MEIAKEDSIKLARYALNEPEHGLVYRPPENCSQELRSIKLKDAFSISLKDLNNINLYGNS